MWLADARRQKVELQDWICAQRGSAPLSCDAKPQLTSSVIMKSLEEKKQKAIGPNWQDGATPSSHSTKFAPL